MIAHRISRKKLETFTSSSPPSIICTTSNWSYTSSRKLFSLPPAWISVGEIKIRHFTSEIKKIEGKIWLGKFRMFTTTGVKQSRRKKRGLRRVHSEFCSFGREWSFVLFTGPVGKKWWNSFWLSRMIEECRFSSTGDGGNSFRFCACPQTAGRTKTI